MPSRRSMLQENNGCLLHLPLSFNGDLSDRISGAALELSGYGSLTWDATEGMYLVKNAATVGRWTARLAINLYPYRFPDNSFTTIGQAKRKSTSGYMSAPFCSKTSNGAATGLGYNGSANLAGFPADTLVKVASVIDDLNNERKGYQQGNLYNTYAEHSPYLPINWGYDGYLYIGYIDNSIRYNSEYYIKELYLFNRVLTAEEIYKIQGY